jgi:outer membrane lipoprotein-sorting protein
MKSARQVERIVGRARLTADPATDERILRDAGAALAKTTDNRPQALPPGPTIWRMIMEKRIAKYSVAAVVALAAALVLWNPLGTSSSGVALAQVQAKIAQVDTMILRGETTFTSVTDPNTTVKYENVKYLSRPEGFVEDGFIKGTRIYRVVLNRREKQGVLLLDPWRKCVRFPCTEEQIKVVEKLTPSGVVDLLLESNDYRRLGTTTIDGTKAEGFEVHNLKPLGNIVPRCLMDLQEGTATIWVGTEELLPIRMEGDMLLGKTIATLFMDVRCHEIAVLDQYNVALDPGLFRTGTPEGYTEFNLKDFLPGTLGLAGLSVAPVGAVAWRRFKARSNKIIDLSL